MPLDFFFSYTRANNDAYLRQFFEDLSVEIRAIRGLPSDEAVGYLDMRELELGEDWDASLVEALQTCKVVVALASPGYFKSEYCGREWALFRERIQPAVGVGNKPPPLLKPVVWVPFKIESLPDEVRSGQLTFGDPQALHNVKGFRYLLKQIQEHRTRYNDLVESLAQEIVAAADGYPTPRLNQVPDLQKVLPAFGRVLTDSGAPAAPIVAGPKHVLFIYVAAHPEAFGNARKPEAYLDTGGPDWKPYYPDNVARIHRYVQKIVAGDDLDFTSEAMPFGANLIERIQEAERLRHIVVLIVDGWTLHWDSLQVAPVYQDLLRALDHRLDYHWCVLVPWNSNDLDAAPQRDAIAATVRNIFDRHANLAPNPMFFRDGIGSAEELKIALAEVLTRLKEEVKKRAPVRMPIPLGPAKSVVAGPTAGT
jgi:FxsC-like protein